MTKIRGYLGHGSILVMLSHQNPLTHREFLSNLSGQNRNVYLNFQQKTQLVTLHTHPILFKFQFFLWFIEMKKKRVNGYELTQDLFHY